MKIRELVLLTLFWFSCFVHSKKNQDVFLSLIQSLYLSFCTTVYLGAPNDTNVPQQPDDKSASSSQNNDPNAAAVVQNGKKDAGLVQQVQQVPPGKPVPKKLPSLSSPPRSRLVPVAKPLGLDPVEIMKEREFRYILCFHFLTQFLLIVLFL